MRDFLTAAGSQQLNGKHHKYLICPGWPQYTKFPHQKTDQQNVFRVQHRESKQMWGSAFPSGSERVASVPRRGSSWLHIDSVRCQRSSCLLISCKMEAVLNPRRFLNPVRQPQAPVLCYKPVLPHTPKLKCSWINILTENLDCERQELSVQQSIRWCHLRGTQEKE